jgi:hypothetical protein
VVLGVIVCIIPRVGEELRFFHDIAPYLSHPLVLIGFVLLLVFSVHRALLKSQLLKPLSPGNSNTILRLLLHYGFIIAILLILAGFGLAFLRESHAATPSIQSGLPSFALEAPMTEISVSGRPVEKLLFVRIVNHGGPATNAQVECVAQASVTVWHDAAATDKGTPGDGNLFDPGCGMPSPGSTYNPNVLRPIFLDDLISYTFKRLPSNVPSGRLTADLQGWFHLSYEDEIGNHHDRYFHLEVEMLPAGEAQIEDMAPTDFAKIRSGQKMPPWPCEFLNRENCPATLLKAILS